MYETVVHTRMFKMCDRRRRGRLMKAYSDNGINFIGEIKIKPVIILVSEH